MPFVMAPRDTEVMPSSSPSRGENEAIADPIQYGANLDPVPQVPLDLLSKKLAAKLVEKVGNVLFVDVNAHVDSSENFVRARVLLPLHASLQKSIKRQERKWSCNSTE